MYIFKGTARHEWLELNIFESIYHAQKLAARWMWIYNNERPHSSLGYITPRMVLNNFTNYSC
ncbi:integrase core domain-containing protein [Spirochaeta cellobiosiphila]|uniref:integrase core domain-containing protein n=1 Tax=Spirochaeta cellobiosiphila TaxID=504483 RepID=UPI000A037B5F